MIQAIARFVVTRVDPMVAGATIVAWLTLATLGLAQEWTDVREAKPFLCRADFPMQGLESLLVELANLQNDLTRQLGVQRPKETIELYLFHDEASYRRYLSCYLPNEPYRRAMFCKWDGPGKVLAHCGPKFRTDIRHECTHALLHATLPVVPLWLDEGLAEYFEMPPEQRAHGHPHLESIRRSVLAGDALSLDQLERVDDFLKPGAGDYYSASWAWVHFMLHGPPEAHDELIRFLADIKANRSPGALSERLAVRLPDVTTEFSQHFRQWRRPVGLAVKEGILDILGGLTR